MKSESGNVIFIILIAVVLFGALSMAVTQSSRSGGDLSQEQARLYAMELLQFYNAMSNAVSNLINIRGCSENELDFANDVWMRWNSDLLRYPEGHNPNSPANGRCSLFKPEGAGLKPYVLPEQASQLYPHGPAHGQPMVETVAIEGFGTPGRMSIVMRTIFVNEQVCKQFSKLTIGEEVIVNVNTGPSPRWPNYTGNSTTRFVRDNVDPPTVIPTDPRFYGKSSYSLFDLDEAAATEFCHVLGVIWKR